MFFWKIFLCKTNVELRKRLSRLNKTNVQLGKRLSGLNKTNVESEKRRASVKTTNKLNFDRKNAPYLWYFFISCSLRLCVIYFILSQFSPFMTGQK